LIDSLPNADVLDSLRLETASCPYAENSVAPAGNGAKPIPENDHLDWRAVSCSIVWRSVARDALF
jgi:hypothetical protein